MSLAGRTLYHLWHRPLASWRHSRRHGGPLMQWRTARGQRAMEAAALALPPLPPRDTRSGPPLVVHLLTGKRYLHQTGFCLHTLARHCPVAVIPEIYDDGSLGREGSDYFKRLSPAAVVHDYATLGARMERSFPADRFPVLSERRKNYPHIRKLTDVHGGRSGARLVLDSDLLFWREPRVLIDWAKTAPAPLHAVDCAESYGYPRALLEKVSGRPVPPLVNVGICGFRSESIDWDFVEHASSALIAAAGTSYYLEQALVALLVAREGAAAVVAPAGDYVTLPGAAEIARPAAVMHHYVDTARGPYLREAWRRALSAS